MQIKAFLRRTAITAAARRFPVAAIYAATAAVTAANAQAYFRGARFGVPDSEDGGSLHEAVARLLMAGVM